jgi:hypothetical protein
MTNDLGGIVYVGKNELCLKFSVGVEHTVRLETTKRLIEIIESQVEMEWETKKLTIEPRYVDPETGNVLTILTVKDGRNDIDRAVVFQTDLWEALMAVECPEVLPECFRKFTPR